MAFSPLVAAAAAAHPISVPYYHLIARGALLLLLLLPPLLLLLLLLVAVAVVVRVQTLVHCSDAQPYQSPSIDHTSRRHQQHAPVPACEAKVMESLSQHARLQAPPSP